MDWYIGIGIALFCIGMFFTIVCMIDYYAAKNRNRPNHEDIEKNRFYVRNAFMVTLLSPVWPVLALLLIAVGFYKVSLVVLGKD